jgi:quinol monooxygenase YgiN
MDMPWVALDEPVADREYLALLSYLPLKTFRGLPIFFRFAVTVIKQMRAAPGALGFSLRAKVIARNFWTLSAWKDEQALRDFVVKLPHIEAMKALNPYMGPTNFTQWKVTGAALPLRWEDAMRRSQQGAQE